VKNDNNLLNDATWYLNFAFESHPQFFDRLAEFNEVQRALKIAILDLAISVGMSGFPDHSCRKNPAHNSIDHLNKVEGYFLPLFHEMVPAEDRTPKYFAAKAEVERLLIEARKLLT
jgi:hypothetical protein